MCLARRGGMVHFLAEIAGGLASLAHVAVVVSAEAELSYLHPRVERHDVKIGRTRLESVMRLLFPVTWFRLAARLRALGADVVHITGVHEWNPLVAILCRIRGVPVVYTVHDPESHPGAPWTIRLADRLTAGLADRLVALTSIGRNQLLERGESPLRIAVVPLPTFTIFRRWKLRAARPEKIILCFGRFEGYKGLDVLIPAFESVRRSMAGWKLIVAGDGSLPVQIGNASSKGVQIINKYLPDGEAAQLMSRCSIVALPYTTATQSGVLALAQAFELPVVASAVGGLTEMVVQGRTGILVPPGNHLAFGRALRDLARDGALRARMRREIRKAAQLKSGPRVIAAAYLKVYSGAQHSRRPL